MDKHSYQGDGKWYAAAKTGLAYMLAIPAGVVGVPMVFSKVFKQGFTLSEVVQHTVRSKSIWAIAGLCAGFNGAVAYINASRAEQQHDQLLADNIAMRGQLDQTGQILRHVANEVGKGKIADSTLNFDESTAPPVHVARLEAQKAAAAATAALAKI